MNVNLKQMLGWVAIGCFVSIPKAYGNVTRSELKVVETKVISSSNTQFNLSLGEVPSQGIQFSVKDFKDKKTMDSEFSVAPMNLIVLADSSSLCTVKQLDQYLNVLTTHLKHSLDEHSNVTLVGYASGKVQTYLSSVSARKIDKVNFNCVSSSRSVSFESILLQTLSKQKSTLPTVVWVFSSGNIGLTSKAHKLLSQKNIELNIVLYNELVEKEIRPNFVVLKNNLKNSKLIVLKATDQVVSLPSLLYRLNVEIPKSWEGNTSTIEIIAKANTETAEVLAQVPVSIVVPRDANVSFIRKYGRTLTIIITLLLLVLLGVKVYIFYRQPKCLVCERYISFKHKTCLFCEKDGQAYLIGNFVLKQEGYLNQGNQKNILPLNSSEVLIGQHRKSPVLHKSSRKQIFVTIKKHLRLEQTCYEIIPNPEAKDAEVKLNDRALKNSRYLGNGDKIEIQGVEYHFFI